jgi:uncharacterized protein (TIGR02118 family)
MSVSVESPAIHEDEENSMIRIAVMYKNEPGKTFDMDYYREQHMPLARERYAPHGLVALEMDEAIAQSGPNAAPFVVIAHMTFPSMAEFTSAIKEAGREVMKDVHNFTDIQPVVQVSTKTEL